MAKALFNYMARQRRLPLWADSAGTHPADRVNPVAADVMREMDIDMSCERPKMLTNGMVEVVGRVITMGCSVDAEACPALLIRNVEDWGLPDPSGKPLQEVRAIRNAIQVKVEHLLDSLALNCIQAMKSRTTDTKHSCSSSLHAAVHLAHISCKGLGHSLN